MIVNQVYLANIGDLPNLIRFLSPFCASVGDALAGGLNFADNIRSSFVPVQFSSVAAQNILVAHKLQAIPVGYAVVQSSTFLLVCNGNSPVFGATFANLKCNVAGATATILFF